MTSAPLRFGLVGTGYWARTAHAPALASAEGIELAAVWGRDPRAAAGLAADYRATAHEDLDAFLAAVDGVAFAVPPYVQAPIAVTAARAGKHLLLEKPIAISESEADGLVEAVTEGEVASVVFFTLRFRAEMRAWLADVTARGGWIGGGRILVGVIAAGVQPVQHPVAAREGRAVGHRPARDLGAVARPRAGDVGNRRRGPGGRQPPGPAPPGRGEQRGDRLAERGPGGRGLRGVRVGSLGPVGRAYRDDRSASANADGAGRAHREHQLGADGA